MTCFQCMIRYSYPSGKCLRIFFLQNISSPVDRAPLLRVKKVSCNIFSQSIFIRLPWFLQEWFIFIISTKMMREFSLLTTVAMVTVKTAYCGYHSNRCQEGKFPHHFCGDNKDESFLKKSRQTDENWLRKNVATDFFDP